MSFKEKVLTIVKNISKGETRSYKEIATLAGNPKAARVVGNLMKRNFNPDIPCHRVVRSNGQIGGFNRGTEEKAKLLKKEKAEFII